MNGFTDKEIIGSLIALLVASYAALFGWVVASIGRLDHKIDSLDAKLSTRTDALDARLNTRLDALTIAVSRLEGAMWGRTPPEPPRKAIVSIPSDSLPPPTAKMLLSLQAGFAQNRKEVLPLRILPINSTRHPLHLFQGEAGTDVHDLRSFIACLLFAT